MVKSIIRGHHYSPSVVDELFLDEEDHWGIEWLYNDLSDEQKELKDRT